MHYYFTQYSFFHTLTYQQKTSWSEIGYLLLVNVVIPLCVGLQIFSIFSHTIGLVVVNILLTPAIVLFYRWLLPRTIFRKRYGVFFLLLPLYLVVYELNTRLSSLIVIRLPFIAQAYKDNLASAHPADFSTNLFNQNIGYTILVLLTAFAFAFFKELYK